MRLAAKLILLFLCGLLLIVGVFSFATLRREREIAIQQHELYAAELAAFAEQRDRQQAHFDQPIFASQQIQIRRVELRSPGDRLQPRVPSERLFVSQNIMTITMPDTLGNDRWYTYVPVSSPINGSYGVPTQRLEVSAPDLNSKDRMRRTVVSSLLTILSVGGLSAIVIYFGGVRMVGKPLDRLIAKVNRVAVGELGDPVEIKSHDELGDLGRAINAMCDSLSRQREQIETETAARIAAVSQLRHADRLRSVGRMAAGIAHEIGTPLNVVSGRAELIASGALSDQATTESAMAIKAESDRIAGTITSLLDFARERPTARERVDVRTIIETTIDLIRPIAAKTDSVIRADLPDLAIMASVDRAQIQQVLTNLVNNAIQSRPSGAKVNVALSDADADRTGFFTITVSDNGSGIPSAVIDQIFEPFFTTKDVGQGTGLGLAISHGIVQEHGGEITVESQQEIGTTFTVKIPVNENSVVMSDQRGQR